VDDSWDLVHEAILSFGLKVPDLARARAALLRVISERAWKRYRPRDGTGQPLGEVCQPASFVEWVGATVPRGLETTVENLEELARGDTKLMGALTNELLRAGGRPETGNNIPSYGRPEGTSEAKALRRLCKDRPDLYAKVIAGEMTAHAAAVEAGFRPHTFTVRADRPESIAATLRRQLDSEVLREVIDLLRND
jgi:hypothetical protein